MRDFLEGYADLAETKITAALVLRIKISDFERLKTTIKTDFPDAFTVKMKTGLGKLWIKEGEEP